MTDKAVFTLDLPGGSIDLGGRPRIMGILNVTPDSFSDGGRYIATETAVEHALKMVESGAEIIDIGGESTRPGAASVSEAEELRRVVPVIAALSEKTGVPISIDTTKYGVARESADAGASIINDITALRNDPKIAELAAERGLPLILMHMQGEPRTMQNAPHYDDLMNEIAEFLRSQIEQAVATGVKREQIIIDPGIGFGKTAEHNLTILQQLAELKSLRQPILVGASRKSTIGLITGKPASNRLSGSLAAAGMAMLGGAHILRVHDVDETLAFVKVVESIRQGHIVCK